MKTIILFCLISFLLNSSILLSNPCKNGMDNIQAAYNYAKKAYNSTNIEELHDYIRKTKSFADDAETNFNSCNCSDAKSNAEDCYSNAKKALNTDDFDEAREYARKAMRSADDAKDEAVDCE